MLANRLLHPSRWSLALAAVSGLAAFLFLWQLGSSSFFIDEAASMRLAELPLTELLPRLRVAENSPAGYFAVLHLWIGLLGTEAEWAARLPSALAALALVPATAWLGRLVDGERAALVAALLTAISPLMLQYAQQARAYTLAMLALTLAAVAAVKAARLRSPRWAMAGGIGCAVALSFHYAALAVVAPLCAWILLRRELEPRVRLVFCVIPAAAWLAWLPLAFLQRQHHPTSQLGEYGTFTLGHLTRVLAAPFDDRYTLEVGPLKVAAAVVIVAALASVAARSRRPDRPELRLMVAVVVVVVMTLSAGALAGIEILNSRYVTFAVPFMLVIVGSAVARSRPPVALAMVAVLLVAGVVYTAGSHRTEGFYPDTRGVIAAVDSAWRPGDALLEQTTLGVQFPLGYYAESRLPAGARVVPIADPAAAPLLAERSRVWIVREERLAPASDAPAPDGFTTVSLRRFPASSELTLELARR